MLGHQLPALPSIQFYLDELKNLFRWLEGKLELNELPTAALGDDVDHDWSPPPIISTWDGAPVESVRFAGANLLLVKMGYKGGHRIVEPYALRRSRAGHLLLCAQRPEESHIKNYRVDRIEGIEVQREVFEPRYPVEFTPGGSITARPTRRVATSPRRPSRAWGATSTTYNYAVECPICGKTFRRKRPSNKLNPHKDPDGYPCPGRTGHRVS